MARSFATPGPPISRCDVPSLTFYELACIVKARVRMIMRSEPMASGASRLPPYTMAPTEFQKFIAP